MSYAIEHPARGPHPDHGVVGLGYWGPNLLRVLVEMPDVRRELDLRPRRASG